METGSSSTTRVVASILGGVPDAIRRRAAEIQQQRLAMRREAEAMRRARGPQPAANPFGVHSVPTLSRLLRIDFRKLTPTVARRIRKALLGVRRSAGRDIDPQPLDPLAVLSREWPRRTYGIWHVNLKSGAKVHYVNFGDTYAPTLLAIERDGRWRYEVGSWGDLVDREG